jgi:hypothetical protein
MIKFNSNNVQKLDITAYEFISSFKSQNEEVYFRTWNEVQRFPIKYSCKFNFHEYSKLNELFLKKQSKGHGIFFIVNNGGTYSPDINSINSYFIDMDFGKVPKLDDNGNRIKLGKKVVFEYRTTEEIKNYKEDFVKRLELFILSPSIVVETKNGFHVYWLINKDKPNDISLFTKLESKLCEYFAKGEVRPEHSDPTVSNLAKVMRIHGFLHLKNPNDPFNLNCLFFETKNKYSEQDMLDAIGTSIEELSKDDKKKSTKNKNHATKKSGEIVKPVINIEKNKSNKQVIDFNYVFTFLKQQDLRSFLGKHQSLGVNFKCDFHDDKHPSANIQCDSSGNYKYFCNSPYCDYHNENGLDIIDIVGKQNDWDTSKSLKHLFDYFNISVTNLDILEDIKTAYDKNYDIINNLPSEKYPKLTRIIRFAYKVLNEMFAIGRENVTNKFFMVNNKSIFFASNRYIGMRLRKHECDVNKYINFLCVLGLIEKVPYAHINEQIRKKALSLAKKNGFNGVGFYCIPNYNDVLDTAEERASIMVQNGFSIKGMSKIYVQNCFGEKFANDIYTVPVKNTNQNIRDAIEIYIIKLVSQRGYCTKKLILTHKLIVDSKEITKDILEYEFRRALPDILMKYCLVYRKSNRLINEALNICTMEYVIIKESLIQ